MTLTINYSDGMSETLSNAFEVIDHGDGEISYFIGAGFTRYHALNVAGYMTTE